MSKLLMDIGASIEDLVSIGISAECVEEGLGKEVIVYVISNLESGLFTIGFTKNPDRRFDEGHVGLKAQEISFGYFENAREVEKAAHDKYPDVRLP